MKKLLPLNIKITFFVYKVHLKGLNWRTHRENLKMRKFVSSVIYSLIMTLLSVVVIFLLQAPLVSFVYYGSFSDNSIAFNTNVINKVANTDAITIIIMIIQLILTLGFVFAMYSFISKMLNIFLKNENLIRPYYFVFFFMTLVMPVFLIFLSIFLRIKLVIVTLIVEVVFTVLNIMLIVLSKKIFPETTYTEYRKHLFTNGVNYE